jgi:hypothetical protein
MAELATGQALFGRDFFFFLFDRSFDEIFFKPVKVILINYIGFRNA